MGIKIRADNLAQMLAAVRSLGRDRVLVGIPSSAPGRRNGEPITNAELGYIHEFGAPAANIPARPFLIPGAESVRNEAAARMKVIGEQALDGDKAAVDRGLHAVGLLAQNAVRKKITDGPFEPLAPATLASRRARGRTGTKPMLDTGQLRASITYVIERKGS